MKTVVKLLAATSIFWALGIAPNVKNVQAAKSPLSATEIVNKVQAYYASAEAYRATFVQTSAHKMMGNRLERAYGQVMFRKGGLMRWDYERPERKLFIYDGAILWIYEPEVPQVFSGAADADKLRKALAFLSGEGRILDEYKALSAKAEKYGFGHGHVLLLQPKAKGSQFKHVELYVDPTDFHVVRSVVVDHEGNRNRLDFGTPELNPGISSKMFQFTPPAGVPVIKADQQF